MARSTRAARACVTLLALVGIVWLGSGASAAAPTTDPSTTSSSSEGSPSDSSSAPSSSTRSTDATTSGTDGQPSAPASTTTESADTTTGTAEVTTSGDVSAVETTTVSQAPVTVRSGTPPAATTSTIPLESVLIAVGVLAVVALLLLGIARGSRTITSATAAATTDRGPPVQAPDHDAELLTLMAAAGEAMIDASYDVGDVRAALESIARAGGMPDAQVIALPTALLVSAASSGRPMTIAVTSGQRQLRLDQIESLDHLLRQVAHQRIATDDALRQLQRITASQPRFGPLVRLAGQMITSLGLAVLLGASWIDMVVATALGAVVGALLLVGRGVPEQFRVLVTVPASFGVALTVFLLSHAGLDIEILPTLVAPLVTLLPGALLTTAVVELATGQMIAGAARLASGAMQLVLLGLGIVAAATLVGVPSIGIADPEPALGAVGPWLAVAVFGAGVVLSQSARPASLGWILLVLYAAYGAQVAGGVVFGVVLSALIGALVMTPVAEFVARQRSGPPAKVGTTPAFWLLVPGALGLIGVADLLSGDSGGRDTLLTMLATMVAIALGMLVGRALNTALFRSVPVPKDDHAPNRGSRRN